MRRRLFRVILFAALVGAVIGALFPVSATADDRRYLRSPVDAGYDGPPPAPLAQQKALIDTGVWVWEYRQDAGVPSIKPAILEAHRDFTSEVGILYIESAGGNKEWARTSATFYYGDGVRSGCPGAVACLNAYGLDVDIWYDAPVMGSFFFESQAGVAGHEFCHASSDCGEMYVHNRGIFCTNKPWTFMDCGLGHALRMQAFDRETIRRFLLPQTFNGGALVGNIIWYGGSDDRTRRIAVFIETYTGYRFFSGQYLTPVIGCTAIVCDGASVAFPLGPCTGLWIGHEGPLPGSWGQNLQRVGGTPCGN